MFTNMIAQRVFRRKYLLNRILAERNKYYVLLPEVPPDTPENNPLLSTNSLPPFRQITHKDCYNALGKLIVEYECGIQKLCLKLSDPAVPKTVQNVILPLDQLGFPLDFAWASFKMLYMLGFDEKISETFEMLHPRIRAAKQQPYYSLPIYSAFKELNSQKDLAEPARRVVKKYVLESYLAGMELPEEKSLQLRDISIKIHKHKKSYRNNLVWCMENFSQKLTMSDVANFPKDLLYKMAVDKSNVLNGPWKVDFTSNTYNSFLERCENRILRWNVWNARHILASSLSGQQNNSLNLEEIRYNRKEQANVLGYESYADLSMETKMAGTVENVQALITTLHVKGRDAVLREVQDLQDFASEQGFKHDLELWDIPFWQRKHKEHLFKIDEAATRKYFPLTTVLHGLFGLCNKLFGISIVESSSPVETWHKDVVYYKIIDKNDVPIASFFMDAYARPSTKAPGARVEIGRNRSDVVGSEPLSYMILHFPPLESGKPSLLSFNDVMVLFQKFGHVLQHSLTTAPYSDVAGLTNLEWDVVNVCPMFMSCWLNHYETVASLSGHVETGECLPGDLHARLLDNHSYMKNYKLNHELYLSSLDMELYGRRKAFWLDIMKELWALFIPFPLTKNHSLPCSFSQIFCDDMAAAYYSPIWSEMVATDLFGAFEEEGLSNEKEMQELGGRFREYFLSAGGACHPSEAFRRFRGRDPSTDAIVRHYGLDDVLLTQLQN